MSNTPTSKLSYQDAGVDIRAGNNFVDDIRADVRGTFRQGVIGKIGEFGGLFDLKAAGWNDPILVSGTDGVGTKLLIANATGIHDTIGIDLVAMCANDIICQGAEPLFFLDYFATGKLERDVAEKVVKGIAIGCKNARCALIGGETAEMPGMYEQGHYDLAGFAVGAADRDNLLPNFQRMKEGDLLIGLTSSGPHSNGFSLIRKVIEICELSYDQKAPFSNKKLGKALLTPTRIYVETVLPLIREQLLNGLAHITGGGLVENLTRVCSEGLRPVVDFDSWNEPEVFGWISDAGNVSKDEMYQTFNMGIGLVLIVSPKKVQLVTERLRNVSESVYIIGTLEAK